ncbi:Pc21g04670 [Penicillium rubens Wisconsin 54-1255]|uniref:Large ribosomal subunit protein mL50 n=2 Tax=Penicillium chrysogenum species complex TaxID=254878 RepID=B6HMP8_PENRW|nr:Pc21g04670 [Penicillium rubens Wisconsin 54-1255]
MSKSWPSGCEHRNAKHQYHRHVIRAFLEFVSPSKPTPPARRSQTAFAPTSTMRPSMRLPVREANFICSSCRIHATPRISPVGQVRRYASDSSPGVLERARRKIWGTDKPPGPADPYTGSQIMPGAGMSPGEPEPEEGFSLEEGQASKEIDGNLTWDGMPKIGFLQEEEWRLQGPKGEADRVEPWYHNPRPLPYMQAAHQAAVEIGLMQMLGEKVTVASKPHTSQALQAQLESVKIEGQSGNWGERLRFPDIETMESLLRDAAGPMDGEAGEIAFQEKLKKVASEQESRLYSAESKGQMQKRLGSLSLADGNVKFVFFARLSKLMSQHIPDYIITSSATTGDVFRAQEALRKKTTRLTPVLLHKIMDKNGATELSNVKILDVRQTRRDNDEDLGRKKAIVSALYKDGLITKSLGQKRPPWKQAKETELNA